MFLNMMEDYDSPSGNGTLFRLNNNYRSDKNVLSFVNHIFNQIMSSEGSEIEYDDTQALSFPDVKVGTSADNDILPRVAVVRHDKEVNSISAILSGVANEVARYVKEGVQYKDICILTQKRKTASAISAYLNECGFASRYADEINVFDDRDIHM